jgi:hypothetical protein
MSKKVPYLETSPEKFQQRDGSGSSSMGCPSPTGSRTAAILQPQRDSSSPTDSPLSTPWDVTWGDAVQADLDQQREEAMENFLGNGEHGASDCELLQFWNQRIPVRMKG